MIKNIRFCYRKIIEPGATKAWEKLVFEASYAEFKMQAQRFNDGGKYNDFSDMLLNVTGADQLHFLVSGAATGYIKQLNGKIPEVLNTLGKHFLPFNNFRFEIINSDIKDISKHKVAISFFSEPVTWLDSIGKTMLLSVNNIIENGELLTDTLMLQPFLSIYSIKQSD
jgi:hypothetical protein